MFTSLHQHSMFSTLDGYGTPEMIIARAKELGMQSIALTDHGNVDGMIKDAENCRQGRNQADYRMRTVSCAESVRQAERREEKPLHRVGTQSDRLGKSAQDAHDCECRRILLPPELSIQHF